MTRVFVSLIGDPAPRDTPLCLYAIFGKWVDTLPHRDMVLP